MLLLLLLIVMVMQMLCCLVYMNKETVNGDASMSNSGPGSVPPRNPSQGPVAQQPNFPTSQAQVTSVVMNCWFVTLPLMDAKYCDEYICLFVQCPLAYLKNHTADRHQSFLSVLPVAMAHFSGNVVICYILLVFICPSIAVAWD